MALTVLSMAETLELYAGLVVLTFVSVFVAAVYYEPVTRTRFRTKTGASLRSALVGFCLGCVVVVAVAVVGRFPPGFFVGRADLFTLALVASPLVGGCVALAVAADNWRLLRRLDHDGTTALATVTPGPGVVTGRVDSVDDPPESPVFGRAAVCWQWRLDARNFAGTTDGKFRTVRTGEGGVSFLLADDARSLRVRPDEASLDLSRSQVEPTDPETFPVNADPATFDASWSLPGDRWRFQERTLAPGDTVTVVGDVTETTEGLVVRDGGPFVLSAGDHGRVRRRYRDRLTASAFLGVAGTTLGGWILTAFFSVPLPF